MTKDEFEAKFENLISQMHDIRGQFEMDGEDSSLPSFLILCAKNPEEMTVASAIASEHQIKLMVRAFLLTNPEYITCIKNAVMETQKVIALKTLENMFDKDNLN